MVNANFMNFTTWNPTNWMELHLNAQNFMALKTKLVRKDQKPDEKNKFSIN